MYEDLVLSSKQTQTYGITKLRIFSREGAKPRRGIRNIMMYSLSIHVFVHPRIQFFFYGIGFILLVYLDIMKK